MAIQTATVPIYLCFWGRQLFSEWVVLTAIPAYLTFTDFGFSVVASNEMAVRAGGGDRRAALEAFQSILAAVVAILSVVFCVSVLLIVALPVDRMLQIRAMSPEAIRWTLVALCLQVLVNIQGAVVLAGYKCDGHYAAGLLATCWTRVIEFVAAVCALALGGGPTAVASTVLLVRVACIGVAWLDLKRRNPWIVMGWSYARRSCVRALIGPALAASGLPIGQAFSFQGMVVAISWAVGPVAATTFATLRNLSRLPVQFVTAAASGSSAEFCLVVGQGDLETARRLLRRITQVVLWATVAMLVMLAAVGGPLYRLWTMHRFGFDYALFGILLVLIVPSTIWINMSNTAVILQRHQRMTGVFVVATVLSVACAFALGSWLGVLFCAAALLVSDSVSAVVALRTTVRAIGDDVAPFVRFVAVPPVGWLIGRARAAQRGVA